MPFAEFLSRAAAELALFAGVGFLLFGVNDLLVDLLYFTRRLWRAATVYTRHRPAYASYYVFNPDPGFIAILVPAWDESAVIASMLKTTLNRLDYDHYRIFVGHIATTRRRLPRSPASPTSACIRSRSRQTARPPRPTASTISTTR